MIFRFLRLIPSEHLIRGYHIGLNIELMLDTLEIIIEWLQVSVSECNRQNPRTKIRFVSRDLIPSYRLWDTCAISSRVNIFDTKPSQPTLTFEV